MNGYQVLNLPETATRTELRQAYRALARRWHPDRFSEGPERDWANDKMAEINAAYRSCLRAPARRGEAEDDGRALNQVQRMIDGGEYLSARRALMAIALRSAEWNYLFGALLLKTRELRKALIYLSVAAHQRPDVPKYAGALRQAQNEAQSGARGRLFALIRNHRR